MDLKFLTRFILVTFWLFNGFCFFEHFYHVQIVFFIFPYFSVFRNYIFQRFYPRDAMLARVVAIWQCVCLSVCHKSKSAEQIGLIFGTGSILQCALRKQGEILWIFAPNSGFRHGISIVKTCYRLRSRKVDVQIVINWTVVGQLSWQYLRAPTLDHCSLSQWSSSSGNSTIPSRGSISDISYCYVYAIEDESVPIQLAQCWFPGSAIFNAKNINTFFSDKLYGSNFIRQRSKTATVWN